MVHPIIPVVITAIGTFFTAICAVFSEKSHDMALTQQEGAKEMEEWNKNGCHLNYSTASGGKEFYGYSYEARGQHLDCDDMPERNVIEEDVESYAKRCSYLDLPYGCREKGDEEAYWQIRISRDEGRDPFANISC